MTTGGSNWQYLSPMGLPQNGSPTVGGGGYTSLLDMKRSASSSGRTPYAEYPDGYLGTVNSRREDRLLTHVQTRLTQRSYQRGIHKGTRVDPQDYYWNDIVNPQSGIDAEAKGQRWTQQGTSAEQINHMGKNHLLSPAQMAKQANDVGVSAPKQIDPVRSERMARLLPKWK